jgi:hypothetical protein
MTCPRYIIGVILRTNAVLFAEEQLEQEINHEVHAENAQSEKYG